VFLFPGTDQIPATEPAFRSKTVGAFILRTYQADVSIQYGLAEGERLNYKAPPKMSVGSLPIIMCLDDWSDAKPFILRGAEDCQEREQLLHPTEWKSLCDAKSSFLPSCYTTVPVKKRTLRELMAMSKDVVPSSPTKMMWSPVKVEQQKSSSTSSSSSFSPLFKKN
jgi:hypothetical protein